MDDSYCKLPISAVFVQRKSLCELRRHASTAVREVAAVMDDVVFEFPFSVFDEFGVARRRNEQPEPRRVFRHRFDLLEVAEVLPDETRTHDGATLRRLALFFSQISKTSRVDVHEPVRGPPLRVVVDKQAAFVAQHRRRESGGQGCKITRFVDC